MSVSWGRESFSLGITCDGGIESWPDFEKDERGSPLNNWILLGTDRRAYVGVVIVLFRTCFAGGTPITVMAIAATIARRIFCSSAKGVIISAITTNQEFHGSLRYAGFFM